MLRRLFTSFSALSLVLLLAAAAMWARSYRVGEAVSYGRWLGEEFLGPTRLYALASTHGVVGFSHVSTGPAFQLNFPEGWWYRRWEPKPPRPIAREAGDRVNVSFLDFQFLHRVIHPGTAQTNLQVPYWFICLGLAGAPLLWLRGRRKRPG